MRAFVAGGQRLRVGRAAGSRWLSVAGCRAGDMQWVLSLQKFLTFWEVCEESQCARVSRARLLESDTNRLAPGPFGSCARTAVRSGEPHKVGSALQASG